MVFIALVTMCPSAKTFICPHPPTVHKDNSKLLVQFSRPVSMGVSIHYPQIYLGLSHLMSLLAIFCVPSILGKSLLSFETLLEHQPLHAYHCHEIPMSSSASTNFSVLCISVSLLSAPLVEIIIFALCSNV